MRWVSVRGGGGCGEVGMAMPVSVWVGSGTRSREVGSVFDFLAGLLSLEAEEME